MVPEFRLPQGEVKSVTRFNVAVAQGTRVALAPVAVGLDDIAFLQYTGGTTGVSKGATLLHRNVLANILQSEAVVQADVRPAGRQAAGHRLCPAAVSHLCAHHLLHVRRPARRDEHPGAQPARHPRVHQDAQGLQGQHVSGGQYVVQRAGQRPGVQQARLLRAGHLQRRRHGGATGHRRTLAQDHRLPGGGGLRPVRDLAGGHQQPARQAGVHGHHRRADPVHRHRHPRR